MPSRVLLDGPSVPTIFVRGTWTRLNDVAWPSGAACAAPARSGPVRGIVMTSSSSGDTSLDASDETSIGESFTGSIAGNGGRSGWSSGLSGVRGGVRSRRGERSALALQAGEERDKGFFERGESFHQQRVRD